MRWMILTALPLALAVAGVSADEDRVEEELKILTGQWSAPITQAIPSGLAPRLPETQAHAYIDFKADGTARVNGFDNEANVTLNPARKPSTVDIEYTAGPLKGKKQYGIYEIKKGKSRELDTWIVVVSDLGQKETDRPKDLTKTLPRTTSYTFQRSITHVID